MHLRNHLEKFYQISYKTGATKADSWVDIEGGIGNFFPMLPCAENFPTNHFILMANRIIE